MKTAITKLKAISFFLVAVSFFNGCAADRVNLVRAGLVHLEKDEEFRGNAYVTAAYVYQEGEDTVIVGDVKRLNTFKNFKGHVDIMVFSPDGDMIQEVSVLYFPRDIPKNGPKTCRFRTRFPFVPPDDATIHVIYHDDPHISPEDFLYNGKGDNGQTPHELTWLTTKTHH